MKVKNKTLLLLASMVWMIAGINIARIGFLSYQGYISIINIILSLIIFVVFWLMIFQKLVQKHTIRIKQYTTEKQYFWNFFDIKSFCIMAFMMTFGILIRNFHLMPQLFIAVFYTGLGLALVFAGASFGHKYLNFQR